MVALRALIAKTQQMKAFILSINMHDYMHIVYQHEIGALSLMSVTVCHCIQKHSLMA